MSNLEKSQTKGAPINNNYFRKSSPESIHVPGEYETRSHHQMDQPSDSHRCYGLASCVSEAITVRWVNAVAFPGFTPAAVNQHPAPLDQPQIFRSEIEKNR
jgi:hypothetical protein